ncbi:MAG: hypothetical protein DMF24_00455 [Verrucomicrobia bacterium]|nr:MAG: hypothetical protein DME90_07240 [Verrucomicrobiota bacterium]PYL63448.1 MAG: hypothetical protein DMF24_00455 [Verrucomicrobiota bacterium]
MKPRPAALGFRVKSGWAAAVLLTGTASSPKLCDVRRLDLSEPRLPETRQPYHAAMGKLETDTTKINRRESLVRSVAQQSIATLLADYRAKGYAISRAGLVVGSQIDPDSIANAHIRAHAFEGQLFRSVLEEVLQTCGIRTGILIERNAYAQAATKFKESNENVRRMIQNFGRAAQGSWRAEQKLAALAAWVALC